MCCVHIIGSSVLTLFETGCERMAPWGWHRWMEGYYGQLVQCMSLYHSVSLILALTMIDLDFRPSTHPPKSSRTSCLGLAISLSTLFVPTSLLKGAPSRLTSTWTVNIRLLNGVLTLLVPRCGCTSSFVPSLLIYNDLCCFTVGSLTFR